MKDLAIGFDHLVDDRRIGRDDVHVILTPQPLEDDFHVKQSEKPAAEAETEGHAAFGLEDER